MRVYWPVLAVVGILVLQIVWLLIVKAGAGRDWIHNNQEILYDDLVHSLVCGSVILLLCSEGFVNTAGWVTLPVLFFGSFAILNTVYQQILTYQLK